MITATTKPANNRKNNVKSLAYNKSVWHMILKKTALYLVLIIYLYLTLTEALM